MRDKPPIGVGPHWYVYRARMKELSDAIGRYLDFIEKHSLCKEVISEYEAIESWASEIVALSRLEVEIMRIEKLQGREKKDA